MANNQNFSDIDIKLTNDFIKPVKNQISGGHVLDLCGGIARCEQILSNLFEKIDICDLFPSFGNTIKEKQGHLL